jgi:hypothetical protein
VLTAGFATAGTVFAAESSCRQQHSSSGSSSSAGGVFSVFLVLAVELGLSEYYLPCVVGRPFFEGCSLSLHVCAEHAGHLT